MMHRYLLLAGLLLLAGAARAQSPGLHAALALATPAGSYSALTGAVADDAGNVYVAGTYGGTVALGATTLPATSRQSGFVAKWHVASARWQWALPVPSTQDVWLTGLAVAGDAVYVGGYFTGTATPGGTALTSAGQADACVLRLDDLGSRVAVAWAQRAGGPGFDACYGLTRQGSALYLAGASTSAQLQFGALAVATPHAASAYVARLTDAAGAGTFNWVRLVGNDAACRFAQVAVQGSAVYATGSFAGALTLGATTLASTGPGDADAVVWKLTDAGAAATAGWALRLGGPGPDDAPALAATADAVYVGGSFGGPSARFGPHTLLNGGGLDAYVARLTDAGATAAVGWAQPLGGAADEAISALAARGNLVYAAGSLATGTAPLSTQTVTADGVSAAFVLLLRDLSTGPTAAWALSAGGAGTTTLTGLALSGARVVAVGEAQQPTTFGSQTVSAATARPYGVLAAYTDAAWLSTAAATALAALPPPYPNPAHARVQVPVPASAAPVTLTLLDALGRAVPLPPPAPGAAEATLDLRGVAPGLYALRLTAGDATVVRRLVVE